jgi:glycosyltransferase involved in cell wall biosynthesis
MRILYFAQWFDPEPMIKGASFVRALIDRGHEVEVVTGFPNYPTGKLYPGYSLSFHQEDVIDGVKVHRVALYPSHDKSSFGRILNYFSFALSAAIHGIWRARPFDVLYVYPPIPAALAARLVSAVRRRPYVMDVQDLWPDSVVKSGMPGVKWMERIIGAMCRIAYRRAARITAQSRGIAARLVERGQPPEKIEVIYNWADEMAARPRGTCDVAPYGFDGKFNVVYGGNLGVMQGLDTLVRAAHLAKQRVPNLQLLLIGDGVEGGRLRQLVGELGATNVRVEPGVARTEVGDVFAAADVLTLHLVDDPLFEITIPQKTQFYLAMGKPVLVGVKGEAAGFVTESGAGIAVEPCNVEAMAQAMTSLAEMPRDELAAMGERARAAYRHSFSFDAAIEATLEVLADAVRSTNRRLDGGNIVHRQL